MSINAERPHFKEIATYLVGQKLNLRLENENIPVILKEANNQFGYSKVILDKKLVLNNGTELPKKTEVVVANEELTMGVVERIKFELPKQNIGWRWG